MKTAVVLLAAIGLTLGSSAAAADDWLVDAPDDQTRHERLSQYLGGFSAPMWEIGYRYEHVYQALEDENHELARYHWKKIRDAMENGYMKRPARQKNADRMFLGEPWKGLDNALAEGDDSENIGRAFQAARDACMACHVAEDVEFMNNQPMFRDTAP